MLVFAKMQIFAPPCLNGDGEKWPFQDNSSVEKASKDLIVEIGMEMVVIVVMR